jgi:hypothetical protein
MAVRPTYLFLYREIRFSGSSPCRSLRPKFVFGVEFPNKGIARHNEKFHMQDSWAYIRLWTPFRRLKHACFPSKGLLKLRLEVHEYLGLYNHQFGGTAPENWYFFTEGASRNISCRPHLSSPTLIGRVATLCNATEKRQLGLMRKQGITTSCILTQHYSELILECSLHENILWSSGKSIKVL